VRTNPTSGDYNLLGPIVTLPKGAYTIVVDGGVGAGGMTIGLLDLATSSWVDQASFYGRCPSTPGTVLALDHVGTTGDKVRVILSNFDPSAEASSWAIRRVRVLRVA
jgi:hypothetical protein